MKLENIKIADLIPYGKNQKQHPNKQIDLLIKNIEKYGFTTPLLIDDKNNIIAGHGRLEAIKKMDYTEVPCVRLGDLTEQEVKALRLADNKIAEMGVWDMELVLEELQNIGNDINLTGFDMDLILRGKPEDDNVPATTKATKAKLGDIYQLGQHRIMCGDSTNKDSVGKLMDGVQAQMCFTDPPYNVDYRGGMSAHSQNKRDGILNDKMSTNNFYLFLSDISKRIIEHTKGGVYICMSSSEIGPLKKAWEEQGGHWQSFIVWVKNNFTLSRADFQNTYEPILYGWPKDIKNHYFVDDRAKANVWEDIRKVKTEYKDGYTTIAFQGFKVRIEGEIKKGEVIRKRQRTDIWRYDKPSASAMHPTMKPVALVEEAVKASSRRDEIVLDLFLGSGSTLIAAEKTERICYGMELDPQYIDVIIKRWEEYTNNKAVKI